MFQLTCNLSQLVLHPATPGFVVDLVIVNKVLISAQGAR